MKKIYLCTFIAMICSASLFSQSSSFSFVHISDIHVSTQSAVNTYDLNGAEAKCYFHTFSNLVPKPAYILATGDISNIGNNSTEADGMYPALTQYLFPKNLMYPGVGALFIDSAQTIPIYFAPGNHDYYTALNTISFTTQTIPYIDSLPVYRKYIAPDTDYAVTTDISVTLFMRSGWDISYLVSTDPRGSGLTDGQIAFIRAQLAANANKRKIIVMHHPASNFEGTTCTGGAYGTIADSATSSFTVNRETFLNICDSMHVDLVLAGHQHQNVVVDRAGNQIDENCTTCGTRFVQTGPAFAGCYRTITVDSSFITVSQPGQGCPADTSIANGIASVEDEINLSVYPDPSNGVFSINLGRNVPAMLQVYNGLGQVVYQQNSTGATIPVNIQSQASGVYFLHLIIQNPTTGESFNYKTSVVVSK